MSNKPEPFLNYEHCKGESPQGTHTCEHREMCKRYVPSGYRLNYKDFWIAETCPKYESKGEQSAGLDW
jgi:hypothetical protein